MLRIRGVLSSKKDSDPIYRHIDQIHLVFEPDFPDYPFDNIA